MKAIQNPLRSTNHGRTLRKSTQEEQGLMEPDQRSRIGEARSGEMFEQFDNAAGFVAAEAVADGLKLGELAIESVGSHGRFPQGYLIARRRVVAQMTGNCCSSRSSNDGLVHARAIISIRLNVLRRG